MFTRNVLSFAAFLGCTLVLLAGDPPTEMKKLEGEWTFTAAEKNGKKAPEEVFKLVMTISGNTMKLDVPGAKDNLAKREFTFTLEPTKNPKWIDLIKTKDPDKGEKGAGIYKLVGDELTICLPEDEGAERPKEFSAPEGSNIHLITLKKK